MRSDEEGVSISAKAAHHVALGVEHQQAIPSGTGRVDQVQHGLGLAAADAAKDQEMPCLALATYRDGWHQRHAIAVDPALGGAGPGEGLQAPAARLQPAPANDPERGGIDAKAQRKAEQRHEPGQAEANNGPEPELKPVQRSILRQVRSAGSPIGVPIAVPKPGQDPLPNTGFNVGRSERCGQSIGERGAGGPPDVPQVCDGAAPLASPSAKSLIIPTLSLPVQSAAQGGHPVIGIVQHAGSAKPKDAWFKRRRLSDIRRRLGLPGHISRENHRELCFDSKNWIQGTLAGDIGGLHKAGGWGREGDVDHHPVIAMEPDRHHLLSLALSCWFRQIGEVAMGPI